MAYVLITGASGGIGKEFALLYARKKYDLVLVARNKQALEEVKAEVEKKYRRTVVILPLDLTGEKAPDEICNSVRIVHFSFTF